MSKIAKKKYKEKKIKIVKLFTFKRYKLSLVLSNKVIPIKIKKYHETI